MIVLSAIGRFFKKIWDWIKQTAWIQPLLIVGIIFGIIFSIPSIVRAINSSKKEKNTYSAYFNNFKLSLRDESKSKADTFTYDLEEVISTDNSAKFKEKYPECGDKFYVAFVATDCDHCEDARDGFSTLEKNFDFYKESYTDLANEEFHLVTIFTDDENADTSDNESAFAAYLKRHETFFEHAASVAYSTAYYENKKLSESDLEALETADPENFLSPTILLVELSGSKYERGVTEVMFGVSGSDKTEKAKTLLDCWRHTGDFSYEQEYK